MEERQEGADPLEVVSGLPEVSSLALHRAACMDPLEVASLVLHHMVCRDQLGGVSSVLHQGICPIGIAARETLCWVSDLLASRIVGLVTEVVCWYQHWQRFHCGHPGLCILASKQM